MHDAERRAAQLERPATTAGGGGEPLDVPAGEDMFAKD